MSRRSRSRSRDRRDTKGNLIGTSTSTSTHTAHIDPSLVAPSQYDPVLFKFLLPTSAIGCVIGIKGATINDIEQKSKVSKIVLSKSKDPPYPGIRDHRIGMCVGTHEQVLVAISLILDKLKESAIQKSNQSREDGASPFFVTILVPSICCGGIIGKGGQTIQKLQTESGAKIVIANKDRRNMTGERSIRLSSPEPKGTLEAIRGILEALQNGEHLFEYDNKTCVYQGNGVSFGSNQANGYGRGDQPQHNLPYPPELHHGNFDRDVRGRDRYGDGRGNFDRGARYGDRYDPRDRSRDRYDQRGNNGGGGGRYEPRHDPRYDSRNDFHRGGDHMHRREDSREFNQGPRGGPPGGPPGGPRGRRPQMTSEVQVADDLIGRLVGMGGAHIHHIERESGTTITISKRGEFYPNTKNRIITIFSDSDAQQQQVQRMIQEAISDPEVSKMSSSRRTNFNPQPNGMVRSGLSGDRLMRECMQVGPGATIPDMYVVAVPDSCIGIIMGQGGKTLREIQDKTGADIECSRRGEFFPDTNNRIMVLKGNYNQVNKCQQMILDALGNSKCSQELQRVQASFQQYPIGASGGGVPQVLARIPRDIQPLQYTTNQHYLQQTVGGPANSGQGYQPPLQSSYQQVPQPLQTSFQQDLRPSYDAYHAASYVAGQVNW